MNKASQVKYLGLGILVGIGITLLTAASGGGGTSVGKYQITAAPGHVYIINTANGQVWDRDANQINPQFNAARE